MKSHGRRLTITKIGIYFLGILLALFIIFGWFDYFNQDNIRHYCLYGEDGDFGFKIDENNYCKINIGAILRGPVFWTSIYIIAYAFFAFCLLKYDKRKTDTKHGAA